jgi:hypothetical protein
VPDVPLELVVPEVDEPLFVEPLVAPASPQSFAAHCGSVGFRFAHLPDLLFWPERVAAGVLVAFWCSAPLVLIWFCALSSPVDFVVLEEVPEAPEVPAMLPLLVSMELVALLSLDGVVVLPREPEVEPLPLIEELVPLLCVVVALFVVLALSFLCFRSPIASAEPLASAMMEVSTNAGASLRILPPIGLYGVEVLAEA